jgi:hypothetical protein
MVIHTVLRDCVPTLPHLCIADAERIIRDAKPRIAFLTHYGMTGLAREPRRGRRGPAASGPAATSARRKDGLSIDL